jgi:alkanesulfonate monooxygenase SsuD/methylene tetrahydromethanopterin reductase-like flavin-dependent oxidoreductase (luciferase family)
VHCYDDEAEAEGYGLWSSVSWWYRNLAEFTLQWELAGMPDEQKAMAFPLLEAAMQTDPPVEKYRREDQIIVGTADEVLEKVIRYDEAGVDQLLCYVQFGSLPHEKIMRNLELLGTKVLPKLEARGHRVDTTVSVAS